MRREPTQTDVQETYDYLFLEASKVLELGGSFVPFGAGLRVDGERTHVNVDLAPEQSSPNDHISGLVMGFREEAHAGRLLLAGLAFDGRVAVDEGLAAEDALIIHIEHAQGEGIQIFLPYRRDGGPETLMFDEPIVQAIEPEIFLRAG